MNPATSADLFFPPKSGVLTPLSSAALTAVLSELAAFPQTGSRRLSPNHSSIIENERSIAIGFAIHPLAMSGADPCTWSQSDNVLRRVTDGACPTPPAG